MRWFKWASYPVVVVALIYLGQQILQRLHELVAQPKPLAFWAVCGGGAIAYALLLLGLAAAWHAVLGGMGLRPSYSTVLGIYGRVQIAKYLPGNVFHFVGRQFYSSTLGGTQKSIALSTLVEHGSLLFAAGCLVAWSRADLAGLSDRTWLWAGLGSALITLLLFLAWRAILRRVALAWAIHLLFFAGCSLLVHGLFRALDPGSAPSLALVLLAVPLSWAAGFLTPGAPGGIGVREATFVMTLSSASPAFAQNAIWVSLGYRLLTVGGDLLLWLASVGLPSNLRKSMPPERSPAAPGTGGSGQE